MNEKSLEKIQNAASFLMWFRSYLPHHLQNTIRPYLDQPYQLALTVLDCCNGCETSSTSEIANKAGINEHTARQVLHALRDSGVVHRSTPKGWLVLK